MLLAAIVLSVVAGCSDPDTDDAASASPKIGFVFVGQRDDLGYNEAAWEGSEAVAKAFPDHEVIRQENVPETEAALTVMEAMVDRGARVIFATSFGHLPFAYELARRHPHVVLVHQGGVEPSPRLDNFGTYWASVFERVFQAGVVAGAATRTGRIGFVAAFGIPATYANVNAFTLGARSVRPDSTTTVVFTDSWCRPDHQAEAAGLLIGLGADVLTQHQDCTATVLRAAEEAGVHAVGYHADGSEIAPRAWLVGSVWSWARLYVEIARVGLSGDFAASPYNGDLRASLSSGDDPFILTEFGSAVSPETRTLVATATQRFRDGGSPFAGPLSDRDGTVRVAAGLIPTTEEIDRMDYFVPGVEVQELD